MVRYQIYLKKIERETEEIEKLKLEFGCLPDYPHLPQPFYKQDDTIDASDPYFWYCGLSMDFDFRQATQKFFPTFLL